MQDILRLLLRLAFGGLMLLHGIPKLMKLFSTPFAEIRFADPLGLGQVTSLIITAIVEVVFATFVLIGFRTRLATYPLIFTMTVAALIVHAGDALKNRELALLYLAGYVAIAILGGGSYSLDAWMGKKE